MTEAEALTEACRLWGHDVPSQGAPAKKYGAVLDDGTPFGKRKKVGVRVRSTASVTYFECYGESQTWEGAFADAERRKGPEPRK